MSKSDTVYFAEAGRGGPIKIGVTNDVPARIRDLQCANAKRLRLLVTVPGDHKTENELHRRFAAERLNGEWFKGKGAVRAFVEELIATAPEARAVEVTPPRTKRKRTMRVGRVRLPPVSRDEWQQMFTVGNGGSIYRTAKAELYFSQLIDSEAILKRQIKEERLAKLGIDPDAPTRSELESAKRVIEKAERSLQTLRTPPTSSATGDSQ